MPEPVEEYLDKLKSHARLPPEDAKAVRAELKDHLDALFLSADPHDPKEIIAMLEVKFGNPAQVGSAIGAVKGGVTRLIRRPGKRLRFALAIVLLIVVCIRWTVAEEFRASTDAAAPMVPAGSRFLVYKLSPTFRAGDVIVFRHAGNREAWLGVVTAIGDESRQITVSRHGRPDMTVLPAEVIGRVFLNTRCSGVGVDKPRWM